MNKDLERARLLLEGATIVGIALCENSTGGGIMIELDNGTIITAGRRNPHDEDGAVNGYSAATIVTKDLGIFNLGTQGGD